MHVSDSRTDKTDRASPGRKGSITKLLHLRPFPLLPLERSFLGAAAAAAAPPVAAAQAPFSCSSPLLLVRLLFFPLLFFWLGIVLDSDVSVIVDLYQRLLSTLWDISVDSMSAVCLQCFSLCIVVVWLSSCTDRKASCSPDSTS